jgi:hypothetical protein
MARISKADHAKILHDIDVGNRKVAEVAEEYGCTPANIYTLLNRLRRAAAAEREPEAAQVETPAAEMAAMATLVVMPGVETGEEPVRKRRAKAAPVPVAVEPTDLFAAGDEPAPPAILEVAPVEPVVVAAPPKVEPVSATVTPLPRRGGAVGASLAKPGFGLAMRTADGDESMMPFRSLEDLLSSAKQILRSVARDPDPVWFSIQLLDLASIDLEVA